MVQSSEPQTKLARKRTTAVPDFGGIEKLEFVRVWDEHGNMRSAAVDVCYSPIHDCANIRASFGISANPLVLGPLCSMRRVGTPRGAKLHWGPHLPMWGRWVHGGLLAHTAQGCFLQCATHHAPVQHKSNHKSAAQPGTVLVHMHGSASCSRSTFLRPTALTAFPETHAHAHSALPPPPPAAAPPPPPPARTAPAVTDRLYMKPWCRC